MKNTKLITIDQDCNQPDGSFLKFVEKQEEELREIERERKKRIRAVRKKII